MATSPKQVPTSSGVDLSSIMSLFGTQQNQKVSANTGPLEALLAELSAPQDGAKQLEALFSQASGQIPKFQAAFGNAIGARSGGNSSVAAALENLLKDTTLAGQKQLADQDLQRQQLQTQAASNLANTTRSVNTNANPNYGNLAKGLGLLQLSGKLGITDKIKQSVLSKGAGSVAAGDAPGGGIFGGVSFPTTGFQDFGVTGPLSLAEGGSGVGGFNFGGGESLFGASDLFSNTFDTANTAYDVANTASDVVGAADAVGGAAGGGNWLSDGWDAVSSWFGFADGGMIGRDKPSTTYRFSSPQGYADGGTVTQRAGGARRSASPSFTPITRSTTGAVNTLPARAGIPGLFDPNRLLDDLTVPESTGGDAAGNPNATPANPGDVASVVNGVVGAVAQGLVGLTGIPGLGLGLSTVTGMPGLIGSIASIASGLTGQAGTAAATAAAGLDGPASGVAPSAAANAAPSGVAAVSQAAQDAIAGMISDDAANSAAAAAAAEGEGSAGGTGSAGPGGADGSGGAGTSDGGTGAASGADGGVGSADGTAYAGGGEVHGPGTGTSDSIPIMASKGEYVIPKDVVDAMGAEFFDMLRDKFHTMTSKAGA